MVTLNKTKWMGNCEIKGCKNKADYGVGNRLYSTEFYFNICQKCLDTLFVEMLDKVSESVRNKYILNINEEEPAKEGAIKIITGKHGKPIAHKFNGEKWIRISAKDAKNIKEII